MVQHFQNSSLLQEDKRCRPVLFHSSGPNAGEAEVRVLPVLDVSYRCSGLTMA